MKFSSHIDKAIWITADKILLATYGIVFVKLSLTYLSAESFGIYVIVYNSIFLLVSNFAASFTLQPMMKYVAENRCYKGILPTAALLSIAFYAIIIGTVTVLHEPLAKLFVDEPFSVTSLNHGLSLLPILALSFLPRQFAIFLLQANYRVIAIFFIDLVFIATAILSIVIMDWGSGLAQASDLIYCTIYGYAASSLVAFCVIFPILKKDMRPTTDNAKKIVTFGSFTLLNSWNHSVYEQLDNYVIIALLTPRDLGIYSAAKIFTRVFQLSTQIVQSLVIPVLSRQYARNAWDIVKTIFEKAVCFTTVTLLPISLLFVFLGPWIMSFVAGGTEFEDAAVVLQLSSLLILITPLASMIGSVYLAADKMKIAGLVSFVSIAINLVTTYVMTQFFDVRGTILGQIIAGLVINSIHIYWLRKLGLLHFNWIDMFLRIRDVKGFLTDYLTSRNRK